MRSSLVMLLFAQLVLALLLAGVGPNRPFPRDRAEAVAALERLGGKLHFSDNSYGRGIACGWPSDGRQLRGVTLRGCRLVDDDLRWLRALPELNWLDLCSTPISDTALQHVAGLRHLRSLILDHTAVTSDGLSQLSGLTQLEWLQLGDTRVDDAGLAYLSRMQDLETLELYSTRVSDRGLVHLKKLQALSSVFINDTRVTPAGAEPGTRAAGLRRDPLTDGRPGHAPASPLRRGLREAFNRVWP